MKGGLGTNSGVVSVLPVTRVCKVTFRFVCRFYSNVRVFFLAGGPSPTVLLNTFSRMGPHLIVTIPLVVRGVVHGTMLPGVRNSMGVLVHIPVMKRGVGRGVYGRLGGIFNKGCCRVVINNTTFGRRVRGLLRSVNFGCAMKCNTARYTPVVSCRS